MSPPLLGAALLFLVTAAACRPSAGPDAPAGAPPKAIAVSALLYADETPTDFFLKSMELLGETLLPELAFAGEAPFSRTSDRGGDACELRIVTVHQGRNGRKPIRSAELESGAVSGATIAVQVAGELECPGDEGPLIFRASAEAEHPVPPRAPDQGLASDAVRDTAALSLREACMEVLTILAGLASTTGLGDDEILALLSASPTTSPGPGPSPGPLAQAALEAGQRRLIAAAAALRRLTAHPHRLVASRAAAALGALRDDSPDTLDALVALTRGDDPARHLAAIHALADIGTAPALRYVSAIADSHPSAALREVARRRLGNASGAPRP